MDYLDKGAIFSQCRQYRRLLWRIWDYGKPEVCFLMLNPSVADDTKDDRTMRKCVGFSARMGFGGLRVVNLWSFISTDPRGVPKDRIRARGPTNDDDVRRAARECDRTVLAWGVNADPGEASRMVRMLRADGHVLWALKLTQNGTPWHPLMLGYDHQPVVYAAAR